MSSRYDKKSFTPAKADARAPQRRRVHGGSPGRPPMAFDVGHGAAAPAAPVRTWRSTVVGIAIGFGIVLAFAMKWLMGYQIDSAEERRVQQKAVRAAAARCYELASNAAINACLKDMEARSGQTQ